MFQHLDWREGRMQLHGSASLALLPLWTWHELALALALQTLP